MQARPVIVLGVDRSGTSMLTEVLTTWGCHAGDPRLLATGNPFNPQGFWEYKPAQQFLYELFDATGVGWWHVDFRAALGELARSPSHRQGAQRLIAEMQSAGMPWIWKEPYFSISLPFWKEMWGEAVYVVAVRNPYRSALSYESFMIPTELQGRFRTIALFLLRWQFFMLSILEDTAGAEPIFVAYEELVRSPLEQCRRLSDLLDRALGGGDLDAQRPSRMAEKINAKLWRQRSQISLEEIPEASREQRDLYEFLLRKVDGEDEGCDPARYPLPACWREYVHNIESLRQILRLRGYTANQAPASSTEASPPPVPAASPPVPADPPPIPLPARRVPRRAP